MSETFIQWRRRILDVYPGCRIDSMNRSGTVTGARAVLAGNVVAIWGDAVAYLYSPAIAEAARRSRENDWW